MKPSTHEAIPESCFTEVCERLQRGSSVKRSLPGGGLLSIDRELPFLCVYRRDPQYADVGTRSFANHEAAYLSAPGDATERPGMASLVQRVSEQASKRFGAFLILEVFAARDAQVAMIEDPQTGERTLPPPTFCIHAEGESRCMETVNTLQFGLEKVRLARQRAEVSVRLDSSVHPAGLKPLLSADQLEAIQGAVIGLSILPVYVDPTTGTVFPDLLEELRQKVSKVLKKAFYTFTVEHTKLRPHHYYSLGRRRIARMVWEVDKKLSEVSTNFDLLLSVTPINAKSCWREFQASDFRNPPRFRYRPLPFDPFVMKRELVDIRVERVDDPTLAHILRSTQDELDRQLTMLMDIGTDNFRFGSFQVYGRVEVDLLAQANAILKMIPPEAPPSPGTRVLGPAEFAQRAEEELELYRQIDPTFAATVELRQDIYSGLIVSGGQLLVGQGTAVPVDRVDALLSHEIGTHLLTRHNGQKQPMKLLESGLAGYDPLQEGLAVLAEFLVDGLNPSRLRLLAARVLAADAMIEGAGFREVFSQMTETHGVPRYTAYTIVLRIFRGGGLTKDAAYLRGLNQVLKHLNTGGELEALYIGKYSHEHIFLVRELLLRQVLRPPAILPRFLTTESAIANLAKLQSFTTVIDLAEALVKV